MATEDEISRRCQYRLAKNMGTSLKELEKTYDHSHNEDAREELIGGKITESDRVLMEL